MSEAQPGHDSGVDLNFRTRDPAAYEEALRQTMQQSLRGRAENDPFRMTVPEWLAYDDPIAMLLYSRTAGSHRRLRLFAVACGRELCRLVPPEAGGRPPNSARHVAELGGAFALAERYADRQIGPAELGPARQVAHLMYDVYCDSPGTMNFVATLACQATWEEDDYDLDWLCKAANLGGVPRTRQAGLGRDLFGNLRSPVACDPAWRTDTTVALARQMYESRDFSAMPILADALQDAGCDNARALDHCCGPGPHVPGCWVVDLVLGKS